MSTTVRNYQFRCLTENAWVTAWGTSPPTACTHDNTHMIDTNSISVIETVSKSITKIQEETVPTGENIRVTTIILDIPAGEVGAITNQVTAWENIPTSVMQIDVVSTAAHEGDVLDIWLLRNATIGALTASSAIGATTFSVSPTVIANALLGFEVRLTNGITTEELGQIKSIDKAANTITVSTAAVNAFSAASPTYVQFSVRPVKNYTFGPGWIRQWGQSKIGGMTVRANSVVTMRYKNQTIDAKRLVMQVEYLY